MPQSLSDLQSFSIPSALHFETGPGNLARAVISTPAARAVIYLHGGHVAEFQPAGQPPLLFMSAKSLFDPKKAIRGGVPIIFPWFGARKDNPSAPQHGFARTSLWSVKSTAQKSSAIELILNLQSNDSTRASWPHEFSVDFRIFVGPSLEMSLTTRNPGREPFSFEQALHTYIAIGDIRTARIAGLANASYIDKVDAFNHKSQGADPIQITGETDRVYLNTQSTCTIDDPTLRRRVIVEKSGSNSTVLWNPWSEKAKSMSDLAPDEWQRLLCIETANAADNAITLAPASSHILTARLRAESLCS